MSRRGEGQFVAMEVNLRGNPKVLGLARALKVHKAMALGLIALLREFVLCNGTASGTVKGFTRAELASFLEWEGPPLRIIGALRDAGFLAWRRGAFVYPHWSETSTGYYAKRRAEERQRSEARRAEGRGGDDQGPTAVGPEADHGSTTVGPEKNGHQVRTTAVGTAAPPGGPPGGASSSASRLGWFEDNYPKGLIERETCAALLARLSDAEWSHLQYAIQVSSRSVWWRERGRAPKPERWLADQEWKRTKLPKPRGSGARTRTAEKAPDGPSAEDAERMRQAFVRRAEIKQRLKAEGVPQEELEDRIDRELIEQQTVERLPS